MNQTKLKAALVKVLSQIQNDSGLECPPLKGTIKPIEEIPEFDSKVWPVAISILADEIGAEIPNEVNIFVDENSNLPRSINQIAEFVGNYVTKQRDQEVAA